MLYYKNSERKGIRGGILKDNLRQVKSLFTEGSKIFGGGLKVGDPRKPKTNRQKADCHARDKSKKAANNKQESARMDIGRRSNLIRRTSRGQGRQGNM